MATNRESRQNSPAPARGVRVLWTRAASHARDACSPRPSPRPSRGSPSTATSAPIFVRAASKCPRGRSSRGCGWMPRRCDARRRTRPQKGGGEPGRASSRKEELGTHARRWGFPCSGAAQVACPQSVADLTVGVALLELGRRIARRPGWRPPHDHWSTAAGQAARRCPGRDRDWGTKPGIRTLLTRSSPQGSRRPGWPCRRQRIATH